MISERGRLQRQAIAIIVAVLAVGGCGERTISPSPPSTAAPTPAPALVAEVSYVPTGIVRCGIIPDWVCTYFIEVEGPDRVVHEGFFDDPYSGTPPPTYGVLGDVPTRLAPGTYHVTFLKQRVTDTGSFMPVPGGTPRLTNRNDIFATCDTTVVVTGPSAIRIDIAFAESSCAATSTVAAPD